MRTTPACEVLMVPTQKRHAEATALCVTRARARQTLGDLGDEDRSRLAAIENALAPALWACRMATDAVDGRPPRVWLLAARSSTATVGPGMGVAVVNMAHELPSVAPRIVVPSKYRLLAFQGLWLEASPTPSGDPASHIRVAARDYLSVMMHSGRIGGVSLGVWGGHRTIPAAHDALDRAAADSLRQWVMRGVSHSRETVRLLSEAAKTKGVAVRDAMAILTEGYLGPTLMETSNRADAAVVTEIAERASEAVTDHSEPTELDLLIAVLAASQDTRAQGWRQLGIDLEIVAGQLLLGRRFREVG